MRLRGCLLGLMMVPLLFVSVALYDDPPPGPFPSPVRHPATCGHPWPCGGEWPERLEGPFERKEVVRVRLTSHDGTILAGTVVLPRLPAGVGAPVVLSSSPLWGAAHAFGGYGPVEAAEGPDAPPLDLLVSEGYAVAGFNVRGTGDSGGCFDAHGHNEQQDLPLLVSWLAAQPWSNGRVAAYGHGYAGTTAMAAAVAHPPALKAVVAIGQTSDLFLSTHTPQGASFDDSTGTGPLMAARHQSRTSPPEATLDDLVRIPGALTEPLCFEETLRHQRAETSNIVGGSRAGDFYDERRLVDHYGNVTAAVLVTGGFQDTGTYMDDIVWDALKQAPKHMILGDWGAGPPLETGWPRPALAWLDFWLKGKGDVASQLDKVRFQDDTRVWHLTHAWPPSKAQDEVLYLQGSLLASRPRDRDVTFTSVPDTQIAGNTIDVRGTRYGTPQVPNHRPPCPGEADTGTRAAFYHRPLRREVLLAGNPVVYLDVTSDRSGGIIGVQLFELEKAFECRNRVPTGYRFLTEGAADLRFHHGGFVAKPFPVGSAVGVRVDLQSLAEVIEKHNRLLVVVSLGPYKDRLGQAEFPTVTLDSGDTAASQIVLPVLHGTLGGTPPALTYPPRPFDPGS